MHVSICINHPYERGACAPAPPAMPRRSRRRRQRALGVRIMKEINYNWAELETSPIRNDPN